MAPSISLPWPRSTQGHRSTPASSAVTLRCCVSRVFVCMQARCEAWQCLYSCDVWRVRSCDVWCVRSCHVWCVRSCDVWCVRSCDVWCVRRRQVAGWVIRPNADNTSCMCTYLMITDVCGSLPTAVVRRATTSQGKLVLTIRNVSDTDGTHRGWAVRCCSCCHWWAGSRFRGVWRDTVRWTYPTCAVTPT